MKHITHWEDDTHLCCHHIDSSSLLLFRVQFLSDPSLSITSVGFSSSWNSENNFLSLHIWQVAPESTIQFYAAPACSACSTTSTSPSPWVCCPTYAWFFPDLLPLCNLDSSFSDFSWWQSLLKWPGIPQWKHCGPFFCRDTGRDLLGELLHLSCCFLSLCSRCSMTTSIFGISALDSRAVTRNWSSQVS